jgi:hypothetical protein
MPLSFQGQPARHARSDGRGGRCHHAQQLDDHRIGDGVIHFVRRASSSHDGERCADKILTRCLPSFALGRAVPERWLQLCRINASRVATVATASAAAARQGTKGVQLDTPRMLARKARRAGHRIRTRYQASRPSRPSSSRECQTHSTKRFARVAVGWTVRKPTCIPTLSLTERLQPRGPCASSLVTRLLVLPHGYLSDFSRPEASAPA